MSVEIKDQKPETRI